MAHECCVAIPHGVTGSSALNDCGMPWSYSLFLVYIHTNAGYIYLNQHYCMGIRYAEVFEAAKSMFTS